MVGNVLYRIRKIMVIEDFRLKVSGEEKVQIKYIDKGGIVVLLEFFNDFVLYIILYGFYFIFEFCLLL